MFPYVLKLNIFETPLVIGSYGLMLGIGFYCAFRLLERELLLKKKSGDLAYYILIGAVIFGLSGAKLLYIFDNFQQFLEHPAQIALSRGGLVVYGGFLLALAGCSLIIRYFKYSVIEVFDITAPSIAVGFAFGRIGCHTSGDGCYGIETGSIFGVSYPNGIVPTFHNVYPTPLFESFFYFLIAALLIILRKDSHPRGWLFSLFLVLIGLVRFLVEFIRINPKVLIGLSQAQLIAIGMICIGSFNLIRIRLKITK